MKNAYQYQDFLAGLDVFSGCNRRELTLIGSLTTLVSVGAGEVIVREGSFAREAFIVADGVMEVSVHDLGADPVAVVGDGQPVGEMALLHRTQRNATVAAMRRSHLLVATPVEFHSMMRQVPSFAAAVESLAELRLLENLAA